ncbi:alpha/beta-hydrolase family protein [Streptomyces narbonensis]
MADVRAVHRRQHGIRPDAHRPGRLAHPVPPCARRHLPGVGHQGGPGRTDLMAPADAHDDADGAAHRGAGGDARHRDRAVPRATTGRTPTIGWSPALAFSEPDWIGEAPGSDVLEGMVWIPFVTFWQVTADLPFSTGVPDGHGHTYKAAYVDGWNAVMRPSGFTPQDLERLRDIIQPPEH